MRFGLLGSLLAHDGENDLPIRGPKARALLTVLLLNANRPVTLDRLTDTLWAADAPATAEASLRNLVARLRRALGDDPGQRLRSVPGGYRLDVADHELDTLRFDRAVRLARAAHRSGDLPGVLAETAAALELWRGEPLADVPEPAADHAAQLEQWREHRLQALEWRFDAELRRGNPHGLIAELTGLVGELPLREAFHGQLMQALDLTGRRAQALAVYQRLRRTLVDELGIEPGPAVQEVHRRILADPQTPTAEPSTIRPKPAQLPSPPAHFLGREDQLAALRTALLARTDRPATAVLSGMAGVGKSALALACAHALRAQFPDGQLFLNLRGATPGLTPLAALPALTALLRGLGIESSALPDDPDTAAALLRTTLAGTRTLLLLDDAADLAQVRPLLPAGPGCAVLITGRTPMLALDGALHLRLDTLSERESVALVERLAGRATADRTVVAIEQTDLTRLVQLCGRLPLALRIVGARLAARRTLPVRGLVGRLEEGEDRLDELELDDLSIRQSLALTYDSLRASTRRPDRRAADALLAVGALDLPEYSAPLLAGVLGLTPAQAAAALDRLAEVALLDEPRVDRYVPHDLVRDYARELTADPEQRVRLTRAALDWYLATASAATLALDAAKHSVRHLPAVAPGAELDRDAALAFGDAEYGNLLVLVDRLADRPWAAAHLLPTVRGLFPYLRARGRHPELAQLNHTALEVARRTGDGLAEAHSLGDLACAHYDMGRYSPALDLIEQSETLWRQLGDRYRERNATSNRGVLLSALGRTEEARAVLERAVALAEEYGDAHGVAMTYCSLGTVVEATDPHLAISYHRRSIEIGRSLGITATEVAGLNNIGVVNLYLGDLDEALRHFDAALAFPAGSAPWGIRVECAKGRIEALRQQGRLTEALTACHDLLSWTTAISEGYGTGLTEHIHGLVLRDLGRPAEAVAAWHNALASLANADVKQIAEIHALIATTETA
ncbi:BTAD domain-containing putative transcriptional regulator [Kitasatospora sp. NPDC092948]|uniref:AfsR/SARP family transcriptional regulator n=1 Tax=Kitasatospora sp. NPDC092948 TaxID=3364088 RepID=UPI003809E314